MPGARQSRYRLGKAHRARPGRDEGWREKRTGLHDFEFIETRRHWFTAPVDHVTDDSVYVLNLIAREHAVVESPDGLFAPFPVNHAETFIVAVRD